MSRACLRAVLGSDAKGDSLVSRTRFAASLALFIIVGMTCEHARCEGQTPRGLRLDVTRDAWISDVGPEADGNNGGAPRLKLKSIQEMSLVDIDARAARRAGRSSRPCCT